jgi:hypothetical protein
MIFIYKGNIMNTDYKYLILLYLLEELFEDGEEPDKE